MTTTPVTSPCIQVCAVDGETGYCLGCGRTLPEVASWSKLDEPGRQQIMAQLPGRRAELRTLGKLGPAA